MLKSQFIRKWWFWLIVVFVIVGVAGGEEDTTSNNSTNTNNDKPKQEQKMKSEYNVGEAAEHNGLNMTVEEVKWLPTNEFSSLKDGQQYCAVKVKITNNSNSDKNYNMFDFKLNDNGNKTDFDEIPMDVNGEYKQYNDNRLESGTLSKGASVDGYLIGAANPNDSVFLEYTGNMFSTNTKVKFNLK